MNEQQFKKMDNQEDTAFWEEDSKIEIAEWILFGLALGFIIVVVGFSLWNKHSEGQKSISDLQLREENINNN